MVSGISKLRTLLLRVGWPVESTLPLLQCEEEFLVLNRISLDWLRDQAALWQFGEFEMMLTRNQPTHVKY